MMDWIAKALTGATLGAALAWGATALTLTGRVDAIERSLQRIEALLYVPVDRRPALDNPTMPAKK